MGLMWAPGSFASDGYHLSSIINGEEGVTFRMDSEVIIFIIVFIDWNKPVGVDHCHDWIGY